MIIRIVKMQFREAEITSFLSMFDEIRDRIKGFEGCYELKLLRDKNDPAVFFTYSRWDSEEALLAYRKSAFFSGTWNKTKALFAGKAEAWTVEETA